MRSRSAEDFASATGTGDNSSGVTYARGELTPIEIGGHVKRCLILLVCVSALVVVAGCGGGGGEGSALSKADYEQQMQALQTKLSSTADELSSAFSDPSDIDAMSKGLRDAADLLDEASAGLDDISPPEDVADAHQSMVDNSAAAADKIRDFADKIENAPLSELQQSLADFQNIEEFATLETAVSDIKAKGYDIGGG